MAYNSPNFLQMSASMSSETKDRTTPLMRQYFQIKGELPDALVMFQVGDFYELFYDDARRASGLLNIVLTSRGTHQGEPIPLCGIPVHAIDNYVSKLLAAGCTVAIVDQQEPAVPGKVVTRAVSQLLTPATLIADHLLPTKKARYIAACVVLDTQLHTILLEPMSGTLTLGIYTTTDTIGAFQAYCTTHQPDEILLTAEFAALLQAALGKKMPYHSIQAADMSVSATEWINTLHQVGLQQGIEGVELGLRLLYAQLHRYHASMLQTIGTVVYQEAASLLRVDMATLHNLDIIATTPGAPDLIDCLDATNTPMGSRALRTWLVQPSRQPQLLEDRLDAVDWLRSQVMLRAQLQALLQEFGDIERPIGRLALARPTVMDLRRLIPALVHGQEVHHLLAQAPRLLQQIAADCVSLHDLGEAIGRTIPAENIADSYIAMGYNEQLDSYRLLLTDVGARIVQFEAEQQQATGISSLKVRYTGAHGYAIEITNTHKHLVPSHYQRQQTLVGRERYTTSELLKLQQEIAIAQEQAATLEQRLWQEFITYLQQYVPTLRRYARALATLDIFVSFATIAADRGYIRPIFGKDREIQIRQGKHPIVGHLLGSAFMPNDTSMHAESLLHMVTGPNMGGKSTYLRQVALLCYMAQCGSFVPAAYAQLPIIDRLFTRIGAGDNLAAGKSTFLIEMEETATICRNSTAQSLVVLDEVGRGTSTTDGVALAQAVVEYIVDSIGCLCLFATHYHELTELAHTARPVEVFHATCQQVGERLVFLHTIQQGVSRQSFGLAVAQLAGMPPAIIARARQLQGNPEGYTQLSISNKVQGDGQRDKPLVE